MTVRTSWDCRGSVLYCWLIVDPYIYINVFDSGFFRETLETFHLQLYPYREGYSMDGLQAASYIHLTANNNHFKVDEQILIMTSGKHLSPWGISMVKCGVGRLTRADWSRDVETTLQSAPVCPTYRSVMAKLWLWLLHTGSACTLSAWSTTLQNVQYNCTVLCLRKTTKRLTYNAD